MRFRLNVGVEPVHSSIHKLSVHVPSLCSVWQIQILSSFGYCCWCCRRCRAPGAYPSSSSRLDAMPQGRRLRFRGPSAAWPFCSRDIDGAGAGMHACRSIRYFSRGAWTSGRVATSVESQAGFMYAGRDSRATAPSTRRLSSSRSVGAGGASAGSTGGDGGRHGDGDNPGALPATATKLNLRSLRTARERGSVRNKRKKSKPVKGEPSSPPPLSPASSSAPGGGGARLLRLSKLLADRAIGTRSEVRATHTFVAITPVWSSWCATRLRRCPCCNLVPVGQRGGHALVTVLAKCERVVLAW